MVMTAFSSSTVHGRAGRSSAPFRKSVGDEAFDLVGAGGRAELGIVHLDDRVQARDHVGDRRDRRMELGIGKTRIVDSEWLRM